MIALYLLIYFSSPVGCNPGGMPWDESSNKDHDDIVYRHVAATCLLDKNDPRKFSLATPDNIISAYTRCYNGIPAKRLGEDIVKTGDYWARVVKNQGLNINSHVDGHRNNKGRDPNKKSNWGGTRTKKPQDQSKWYHQDARDSMKELFEVAHDRFQGELSKLQKFKPVYTAPPMACMDPDGIIRQFNDSTTAPTTDATSTGII